jgi:hypothetical protein
MNPPTTDPFAVPADDSRAEQPRGAVIELVERHKGRKRPYTGADSIIIPNHMRINGVAILASVDNPATLCETTLDGKCGSLFQVTVQVLARALQAGGIPSFTAAAEQRSDDDAAAIIEIPEVEAWAEGDHLERHHVLLNGHRVWTTGQVVVGRAATHGPDRNAAMVTMTLLCRQLIVDDEPAELYDAGGTLPGGIAVVNDTGQPIRVAGADTP